MNFYDVLAAEKWNGGIPTINFFDLLFAQFIGGEAWGTYEGTLPATINANGDDMRQYQIYGNTGGVGDKTVQLFDKNATDTDNGYVSGAYIRSDGATSVSVHWMITEYIEINQNENYTLDKLNGGVAAYCLYDSAKNYISGSNYNDESTITFNSGNAKYIRFSVVINPELSAYNLDVLTFTEGTTPPETFVPFGYEVDISTSDATSNTTTPIYIGDDPLEKDEYVDYAEQKIYHINNLWDITAEDFENSSIISGAAKGFVITGLIPNTEYTLSSSIPRKTDAANLWFNGGSTVNNGVWDGNSRTSTSNENGEVIIYYRETELTNYGKYWYRLVETLNPYLPPTDPPVTLPALPTAEGTTIIDYVGQSVAPEKVLLEYKKGGN
jgi:hypothetical protein